MFNNRYNDDSLPLRSSFVLLASLLQLLNTVVFSLLQQPQDTYYIGKYCYRSHLIDEFRKIRKLAQSPKRSSRSECEMQQSDCQNSFP